MILVHCPHWLGDMLMAIPFLHGLKKKHSEDKILAIADPAHEAIFNRLKLDLEVHYFKKSERQNLRTFLSSRQFDGAYFLTNSFGSIWPYLRAGIKPRIGFGGKFTRFLLNETHFNAPKGEQGKRNLALIGNPEYPKSTSLLNIKESPDQPPHLMLFPGANYGPSKLWNINSYAEVIKNCASKHWAISIHGSPKDRDVATQILSKIPEIPIDNHCGEFSLEQLFQWVEKLDRPLCLANDSGALHLMSACGVPSVGMYFSTSTQNTPPAFGSFSLHEADIACRPCYQRDCPYKHYECRDKISSDQVISSLEKIINS